MTAAHGSASHSGRPTSTAQERLVPGEVRDGGYRELSVEALVDGAGIPLALGDPDLTVASATAGVLATLTALLGAADGRAARPK
jgi:hypothetical protein